MIEHVLLLFVVVVVVVVVVVAYHVTTSQDNNVHDVCGNTEHTDDDTHVAMVPLIPLTKRHQLTVRRHLRSRPYDTAVHRRRH